jgi:hypothetical protein
MNCGSMGPPWFPGYGSGVLWSASAAKGGESVGGILQWLRRFRLTVTAEMAWDLGVEAGEGEGFADGLAV